MADLSIVWRETHACSINGLIKVQVNLVTLRDSPNCQIKITVNISVLGVIIKSLSMVTIKL